MIVHALSRCGLSGTAMDVHKAFHLCITKSCLCVGTVIPHANDGLSDMGRETYETGALHTFLYDY